MSLAQHMRRPESAPRAAVRGASPNASVAAVPLEYDLLIIGAAAEAVFIAIAVIGNPLPLVVAAASARGEVVAAAAAAAAHQSGMTIGSFGRSSGGGGGAGVPKLATSTICSSLERRQRRCSSPSRS
jgi:hypothetical protein